MPGGDRTGARLLPEGGVVSFCRQIDKSNKHGRHTHRKCATCGHWKGIGHFPRQEGRRSLLCSVCIRAAEYEANKPRVLGWE